MGSVRAARERIESGTTDSRMSEDSMDSQTTWPLAGANNAFQQSQNRNIAPQRPPRPSYVPSILGEQESQEYGQSQQYSRVGGQQQQQPKYWEPNYATSGALTPGTSSSRDSAGSSVGSIPDFPVPALPTNPPQAIPRRPQNGGPPPTQRRGPSSYYSQSSHVAPIPEESVEMSQQSPHLTQRHQITSEDWYDDTPSIHIDRDSTISAPGDHLVEPAGLVRNASMGRQYKPSLTIVRPANEITRQQKGYIAPQPTNVDRSHLAAEHTVLFESADSDDEEPSFRGRDSMEGTTFLRGPSADSDTNKADLLGEKDMLVSPLDSREHSPIRQSQRIEQIMAGLGKGNASQPGNFAPAVVADRRSKLAPFDFATESADRASTTSLSDLIRRATKVRTNLEKGRTASRLGLRDFFTSTKPDMNRAQKDELNRESLTDMLESFPPPVVHTPNKDETSQWSPAVPIKSVQTPIPTAQRSLPPRTSKNRSRRTPQGRKCCGLPMWGFILLVALLILLVLAAILIPIFLIVIPNQSKSGACSNLLPCGNGGYSLTATDGCRCICTGGFTGMQCNQAALDPTDCTTANLGRFDQVTIGTKVLPLLSGSSNYSIPLNDTILLSLFSSNDLSCRDESNLVTFLNAGTNQKRDVRAPIPTPAAILAPRQEIPRDAPVSFPGSIIVDQPSSTTTSSGSQPTANTPTSSQVGFAETAILYVLQQNTIDNARSTRNTLDKAFQNGNWFGPLVVNSNITVDLRLSIVTVGGVEVGPGA